MSSSGSDTDVSANTRTDRNVAGVFTTPMNTIPDALVLSSADHPGLKLTNEPLTTDNYITWSQEVCTALLTKDKLGFIDGSLTEPENPVELKLWIKVDAMVRTWIKNSVSKEMQGVCIFAKSAFEIWESLRDKYGQYNGVVISRLKKSITTLEQGDCSLSVYYTKLEQLWNELLVIDPPYTCKSKRCRAKTMERVNKEKTIQFLNGLNDSYEMLKDQILLIEPLPDMKKAYSLLLQIEQKRGNTVNVNHAILAVDTKRFEKNVADKRKTSFIDKKNMICSYCKKKGHSKETCFKLNGVPDWFRELQEKRGSAGSSAKPVANVEKAVPKESDDLISKMVAEMKKLLSTKSEETPFEALNSVVEFSGPGY